jgi:hypothetical protein
VLGDAALAHARTRPAAGDALILGVERAAPQANFGRKGISTLAYVVPSFSSARLARKVKLPLASAGMSGK